MTMTTTKTKTTDNPMIRTLTHTASGACCQIHETGATVLSYKDSSTKEWLFLSRDAVLDGRKAVRGGIPLVFPIFGPSPDGSTMPQHGFARVNKWTFNEASSSATDTAESASCIYTLDSGTAVAGRGTGNPWEAGGSVLASAQLLLKVEIGASQLKTTLTMTNTGESSSSGCFDFQALQHTYLAVDEHAANNGDQCWVQGLEGYTCTDKVDDSKTGAVHGKDNIVLVGEVDRVYAPPNGKNECKVKVGVGSGRTLQLAATAVVNGESQPVSTVVWNPAAAKAAAMGDFGSDQFVSMICVEPGLLSAASLEVGQSAVLEQTLSQV